METIKWDPFQLTPYLWPLGIFVLGDSVILLPFWLIVFLVRVITGNNNLLLLLTSLFWIVRSAGEIIYWLNQQFSSLNRNPPQRQKFLSQYFPGDSIWFIYQLFWQAVLILSLFSLVLVLKRI